MPHNKTVWEGLGCMALEEVCHWGGKFRGIKAHVRPSITPFSTRAQCLLPLHYAPHHDDDGLWPSDPVSTPQLNDLIDQLPLVSVSPHRNRIGTKTPPNWHQPLGPDVCSAHCASCGHKLAHSLLPHTQRPPCPPVPRLQFQYRSGHVKSPIHTASALTPEGKGALSLITAHTLSPNTLIIAEGLITMRLSATLPLSPSHITQLESDRCHLPHWHPRLVAFKKLTNVVGSSDPVDSPTSRWSPERQGRHQSGSPHPRLQHPRLQQQSSKDMEEVASNWSGECLDGNRTEPKTTRPDDVIPQDEEND